MKYILSKHLEVFIIAIFFLIPLNEIVAQINFKDQSGNSERVLNINNVRGPLITNNSNVSPYELQFSNNISPDFVLSGFEGNYSILIFDFADKEKGDYTILNSGVLVHNPNLIQKDIKERIDPDINLLRLHYLISSRNFSYTSYNAILSSLRINKSFKLEENPYYLMYLGDSCLNFETTIEKVDFITLDTALQYYLKSFELENKSRKFINNALFPTFLRVVDTLYQRNEYPTISKYIASFDTIDSYLSSENENKDLSWGLLYKILYSKIQEIINSESGKYSRIKYEEELKKNFELLRKNYSNKYKAYHLQITSLYIFQQESPDFYSELTGLIKEFHEEKENEETDEMKELRGEIEIVENELKRKN